MKHTVFLVLFAVIGGLFAPGSWAAPTINSVNGTVSHNQSITISGSGFGSKAKPAPFLWDTVDNIDAYKNVSNGQTVPVGSGYPWVANRDFVMSLNEGRAGGKAYKGVNTRRGGVDGRALGGSPSHIYVSWWWKPSANPNLPSGEHSSKFLRLSNSGDPSNKTFSWTQMQSIVWDNPNYLANIWKSYPGAVNQWNFHEVWFDNVARTYNIKVNGAWLVQNQKWSGGSGFYMNLLWGIGWDGGGSNPPSLTTWMDDIYYDNTIARVMLGNASTYAASTRFEMQPATTWSSSSLSVTINKGTFNAGDTAYIYVVDSAGAVNTSGYAVKIGGTVEEPPTQTVVAPPTGLRIVN